MLRQQVDVCMVVYISQPLNGSKENIHHCPHLPAIVIGSMGIAYMVIKLNTVAAAVQRGKDGRK